MRITLRATSLDDQPLPRPLSASFDVQGGTIGRSRENHLALPDPRRHISRRQARVVAAGSGFAIHNIGRANPISVRGQVLQHGEWTLLRPGDELRMGGYLLQATDGQEGPEVEWLLDRFSPARLERELGRPGVLQRLFPVLPVLRQARLWKLYVQRFEGLRVDTLREIERLVDEKALTRPGEDKV